MWFPFLKEESVRIMKKGRKSKREIRRVSIGGREKVFRLFDHLSIKKIFK